MYRVELVTDNNLSPRPGVQISRKNKTLFLTWDDKWLEFTGRAWKVCEPPELSEEEREDIKRARGKSAVAPVVDEGNCYAAIVRIIEKPWVTESPHKALTDYLKSYPGAQLCCNVLSPLMHVYQWQKSEQNWGIWSAADIQATRDLAFDLLEQFAILWITSEAEKLRKFLREHLPIVHKHLQRCWNRADALALPDLLGPKRYTVKGRYWVPDEVNYRNDRSPSDYTTDAIDASEIGEMASAADTVRALNTSVGAVLRGIHKGIIASSTEDGIIHVCFRDAVKYLSPEGVEPPCEGVQVAAEYTPGGIDEPQPEVLHCETTKETIMKKSNVPPGVPDGFVGIRQIKEQLPVAYTTMLEAIRSNLEWFAGIAIMIEGRWFADPARLGPRYVELKNISATPTQRHTQPTEKNTERRSRADRRQGGRIDTPAVAPNIEGVITLIPLEQVHRLLQSRAVELGGTTYITSDIFAKIGA